MATAPALVFCLLSANCNLKVKRIKLDFKAGFQSGLKWQQKSLEQDKFMMPNKRFSLAAVNLTFAWANTYWTSDEKKVGKGYKKVSNKHLDENRTQILMNI